LFVLSNQIYRKLRIFFACPGDVNEERKRLQNIVDRLQKSANQAGFFLELKEWRQVIPDMGRPQQVIFDQIDPKTWDIFIGILWKRFGSPSGGSHPINDLPLESGTYEEFLKAYELWKNYDCPRILFYRCTRSPERLDQIDPAQLAKVISFFAEFETARAHPGIYKPYVTVEEFDHLAYDHLNELISSESKSATLKREVEKEIFAKAGENVKTDVNPAKDLILQVIEQIEKTYETRGAASGLTTGFVGLDQITNGLHPAEMIVIAALPSMGKTALAMNIVEHVALDVGKAVAVFSLEMSSQQLMRRLLCTRAKVDLRRVLSGFLSERDFPNLTAAASQIASSALFIDDRPGLSVIELRDKARQLKSQYDIQLIVIDCLQLLRSPSRWDTREMEMSEISADVKGLAKELSLPVIMVVQLSRQPDADTRTKEGRRPRLSDLRESGSIEQDADVVGLLVRSEYYEMGDVDIKASEATLIIAKQRNGPTGDVPLTFLKQYIRFETRARESN
jgi:replicative DNA helicase